MGLIKRFFSGRLSEDEKKVAAILARGPMPQKELVAKLGVNPVKFNKLMRSLEEQGIAKREPKGRENIVRLV